MIIKKPREKKDGKAKKKSYPTAKKNLVRGHAFMMSAKNV